MYSNVYFISFRYSSIRQVIHLASAITCGTTRMSEIECLDDNHRSASINGKAVELEDIKNFVFERLEAAKFVLEKEIPFRHKFEQFRYTCAKIVDSLRNWKIEINAE